MFEPRIGLNLEQLEDIFVVLVLVLRPVVLVLVLEKRSVYIIGSLLLSCFSCGNVTFWSSSLVFLAEKFSLSKTTYFCQAWLSPW